MISKRKRRATSEREDLSKPSVWRLQHGGFDPPSFDLDPESGAVVVHRRAVDTLGMMLSNGTITEPLYDAGVQFRTQFRKAAIEHVATSAMLRLPGGGGDQMLEGTIHARRRIADAMDVLGGHDSATGSCAWHVLGTEASVREWAMRQGWGGKLVSPPQAQGILVATLTVLAVHFGLLGRQRAA